MRCLGHQSACAYQIQFLSSHIPAGKTVDIMQVVTIPLFLAYNGYKKDLQAEEVYECLISLDDQTPGWVQHAKDFLRACMVKQI
eukprot:3813608-Ditylum_brightwellii.AAC.1